MRKIRIAQIGINRYSHSHEVFCTLTKTCSDIFETVGYAVVEDERETCSEKLKYFKDLPELTLEEILSDETIEAVTVETDEIHLLKYAQMAADAGKHIHMEKPGSQNPADFQKLIETVKKNGKVFHIGYMYRYNPLISRAIEDAKNGAFGTVYSVEAHMSRWDEKPTREWLSSFRGSMMSLISGCHLIDLVLQIQGMPKNVIALNTSTGLDGVDSEDLGFAVLQYERGISVVRMGATEVGGFYRRQLVVCGSKGTLEINPLEIHAEGKGSYAERAEQTLRILDSDGHTKTEKTESEVFQRYEAMLRAFGAMVRGETENPYTPEYELQLFRVILQCCGIKEEEAQ